MRRSSAVALAVVAGLVVATGAWLLLNRGSADESGPVAMDRRLPALSAPALDGTVASTALLRGKVGVVNVWATWCAPCRREQPALARLARRYGDRVAFLGINYRDERAGARRWVGDEFDVPYPSLFDPSGRTAVQLDFPALPDTYLVDASGTIRWWVLGEASEQELSRLIDQLLAEGSPSA